MENKFQGLDDKDVLERLQRAGYNELPSQKRQSIFSLFINVIREPMLLMLIGSGIIYLFLGDVKDALMLLTFVIVVIGITFYQERKTEKALDALKKLASPKALVIRHGEEKYIFSKELVKDDIILLKEGDRVPADAVLLSTTNLLVDESLLTGESLAVGKSLWNGRDPMISAGGENLPYIFSGTMITQGHAIAKVIATGINTQIGHIGKSLQTIKEEDTLLKRETDKIIKNFTIIGLALCALIVIIYVLTKGNFIKGFLAGITLGMALLPEEFPVILLVFLTLGAWRLSKSNVLTRKTAAIETLGAATTLCVDKTGTLTFNKMKLEALMVNGQTFNFQREKTRHLPEIFHPLCEYAYLASQKNPFDPIEKEIKSNMEKFLADSEHVHINWELIKEYPLSKSLLALSHVWASPNAKKYVIATKGAPEAIGDLCHLTKSQKQTLIAQINTMTGNGLRVLGIARSLFDKRVLPTTQHDYDFEFIGLIGFTDPVRAVVKQSITNCYNAKVRVIMITGDYPNTAQYIAHQIGLKNPEHYITGQQLASMKQEELCEKIKSINIFARVVPEQKLAIVNALKANGEIVAMTGDGVNDAPALKSAHIGIAMGEKGTDVAREAADLVLLDDDFSTIVIAIRLGRRIFDNLKKAISFTISVHIPIAGMSLLPIVFNMPIILFPAHIAFLELIIDPACSVVFESEREEPNIMNRAPRKLDRPLMDKRVFVVSMLQGLGILLCVFAVYIMGLRLHLPENEVRMLTFITIVFCNMMLIITNLSQTQNFVNIIKNKNKSLYVVLGSTLVFLLLILRTPFLRDVFYFSPANFTHFTMAFLIAVVSIIWFELYKFIRLRK